MGHVFSCTCQAKDSALVAVVVDAVTALTLIATSEVGVTSVVSTAGGDKMQTAAGPGAHSSHPAFSLQLLAGPAQITIDQVGPFASNCDDLRSNSTGLN